MKEFGFTRATLHYITYEYSESTQMRCFLGNELAGTGTQEGPPHSLDITRLNFLFLEAPDAHNLPQ